MALVLATGGVYALLSFTVARATTEIAIQPTDALKSTEGALH